MRVTIRNSSRVVLYDPKAAHGKLFPEPTDDELNEIYSSNYYNAWGTDTDYHTVNELKKATAKKVLSDFTPKGRLLDCGTAYGSLIAVATEKGWDCYGVERNPTAIEKLVISKNKVFQGMFEKARFDLPNGGKNQFALITMCDFIEHVRNPFGVIEKASELLETGGSIAITTPNINSLSRKIMGKNWPHLKDEHLNYFSPESLGKILHDCGLQTTKIAKAQKCLNLNYLHRQFTTYGPKLLGKLTSTLTLLAPSIQKRPIFLSLGEMLITAKKK